MTTSIGRRHWWTLGALFALASVYWRWMTHSAAYRLALDGAGDIALPGANGDSAAVRELANTMPAAALEAYRTVLWMDNGFVLLLLTALLFIVWMLRREDLSGRANRLAAAALVYAVADWTENALSLLLFAPGGAAGLERWIVGAMMVKWLALAAALVLALLGAARLRGSGPSWWLAFFRDVPYIIDGLWRRTELIANQEYAWRDAKDGQPAGFRERPWWKKPPFGYLCATLVFVAFGPTLDALCSVAPQPLPQALPYAGGVALALFLWYFYPVVKRSIHGPVDTRFGTPDLRDVTLAQPRTLLDERSRVTKTILWTAALTLIGAGVAATVTMIRGAHEVNACARAAFSVWTVLALACVAAIVVYAGVVYSRASTAALVWVQAALFAAVCGVVLCLFAGDVEADSVPYRHVFGFLAPAILVSLVLAPLFARLLLRPTRRPGRRWRIDGITQPTRDFFAAQIPQTELFVSREFPPRPHGSHVAFAMIRALTYRGLSLLLPPSLLAFVAPADWMPTLWGYGFVVSLLLSTWGSMSRRWAQMNRHVDRWFLSGTALFVSIFVVVIGSLRVAGVDYATTILDAAPFGVLFATVVMSYMLSWLVEYWINRTIGVELLAVLGGDAERAAMACDLPAPVNPQIHVAPQGRILAYHGLGRFLVAGRLTGQHVAEGAAPAAGTAFHSYDLLELFGVLAGPRADELGEVVRSSNLYFYAMNAVLLLVFAAFGAAYFAMEREMPVAVVTVPAGKPGGELKDLVPKLLAPADGNRPAIVVIGSGGGTRAALDTSHVLQGLHGIGAGEDIVLLSGVSGGGVALAYFAAHYTELATARSAPEKWDGFRDAAATNLIGDVLEGAQEWRIFGPTPLSTLLAESLERNMLKGTPTMALPDAPPLILNTTITGHPAEDSEVLMKTLAKPADCNEAARPYNMMNGGRLVFTNLRNTGAFPTTRVELPSPVTLTEPAPGKPPIPNTRLPYWVVKDPAVRLAHAAALNANFPPVFPNARVSIDDYKPGECGKRSYLVTDGGAQENLGLVSALYAVQSALREIEADCRAKKKCGPLRPLHFVIAEASGAGYDYSQDRGISAALGGAKDRLTGGLTNALIDETLEIYRRLGVNDAKHVQFHYLPLPLAFRARGGFGTHWMHAENFELADPRSRTRSHDRLSSTTIHRREIDRMWLALHHKDGRFCSTPVPDGTIATDAVQRWICGAPRGVDAPPRDLHVEAWKRVVDTLRR